MTECANCGTEILGEPTRYIQGTNSDGLPEFYPVCDDYEFGDGVDDTLEMDFSLPKDSILSGELADLNVYRRFPGVRVLND